MKPFTWRELVWVTTGFAALTAVLTYPQVALLSTHMAPHFDPMFSVWRLAWIAHQLPRDPTHLFDANIFYPEAHTLGYSDALLLPALLGAPLIWSGVSTVPVHNLLVLVSFVACGVSMYALVRELTGSAAAGWFSGIVFAFQPYRFAHYIHFELLWAWPIPLAFLALHRMLQLRRVRDGIWLGILVALQTLSSVYYGVFLLTGLAVLGIALVAGRARYSDVALLKPALVAAGVFGVIVAPYALAYAQSRQIVGLRDDWDVWRWSPTLLNYIATHHTNWLYGRFTGQLGDQEGILFPGAVAVVAGICGVLGRLDRRSIAYAVLLVVAFDLSLGFHGFLYRPIYEVLFVYRGLRVPARMFALVSAALAVLGGYGVAWLLSRIASSARRRAAAIALSGLVLLESASMPLELERVPTPSAVYAWLAKQPPTVIMEWPLPRAAALGLTRDPLYMYYSTFHWQRLVNGYSGFYPESYIELVESVASLPSRAAAQYMRKRSVQYLVVHSEFMPRFEEFAVAVGNSGDFEPLFTVREAKGVAAVYRLR
jgi:hypothetical protein